MATSISINFLNYVVQAGGIFVDRALRRMLEDKLRRSKFNHDNYFREMVESFERKVYSVHSRCLFGC
jgi:hypothetical protein